MGMFENYLAQQKAQQEKAQLAAAMNSGGANWLQSQGKMPGGYTAPWQQQPLSANAAGLLGPDGTTGTATPPVPQPQPAAPVMPQRRAMPAPQPVLPRTVQAAPMTPNFFPAPTAATTGPTMAQSLPASTGAFPKLSQSAFQKNAFGGQFNPDTGGTDYLGGAVSYNPKDGQTASQRLGIFGASLKDAGAYLDGKPQYATNLSDTETTQKDDDATKTSKDLLSKTRADLVASNGDPDKVRAAILSYTLAGGDGAKLYSAITQGNPTLKGFSADDNIVSSDPLSGTDTIVSRATPKPQVSAGMQFVNGQWSKIPGYAAQQKDIADGKRKPAATGQIAIPANPYITH